MLLSQLSARSHALKQKVYLFGEDITSANQSGISNQPEETSTPEISSHGMLRVGTALSPKIPHLKLKEQPKMVRAIEKRRSKVSCISKNSSLLEYQSYVDQNMQKYIVSNNPEALSRNLEQTLKKSQTISYQKSRQSISPKCKGPRINYNLRLLIKNRRPSTLSHAKEYGQLLKAVRVM